MASFTYYPHPIVFELGPFALRWYALAYIAGLLLGWQYISHLVKQTPRALTRPQVDDLLVWIAAGVIFCGRLGFVLFYQPEFFINHPVEIVKLWHGGMSAHGGLIGIIVAMFLFSKRQGARFYAVTDAVFCAAPLGLFFGRLANFANGELYGRVVGPKALFGIVFAEGGGPLPRHPSQLYEAGLEGLALFFIMLAFWKQPSIRERPGLLTGIGLCFYGAFRIICEMFREPDYYIGFILQRFTMGQLLSLPMIACGVALILWQRRCPATSL